MLSLFDTYLYAFLCFACGIIVGIFLFDAWLQEKFGNWLTILSRQQTRRRTVADIDVYTPEEIAMIEQRSYTDFIIMDNRVENDRGDDRCEYRQYDNVMKDINDWSREV